MSNDQLKQKIMHAVCDKWRSRTAAIVKYNKENQVKLAQVVHIELKGYLDAMQTVALLLNDEELDENLFFLDLTLTYFDTPPPLPVHRQKTKQEFFTVDDDGAFILAPSIGDVYRSRDGQQHTIAALWRSGVAFHGGPYITALQLQNYTLQKSADKKTTLGYRVGEPHSATCPA